MQGPIETGNEEIQCLGLLRICQADGASTLASLLGLLFSLPNAATILQTYVVESYQAP